MMKVEFLHRFTKKTRFQDLSEEDKAHVEAKKVIEDDYDFNEDPEYNGFKYGYVMLDLKDIEEAMELDARHTQVNKYNGKAWVLKIPYNEFKQIYMDRTGFGILETDYSGL